MRAGRSGRRGETVAATAGRQSRFAASPAPVIRGGTFTPLLRRVGHATARRTRPMRGHLSSAGRDLSGDGDDPAPGRRGRSRRRPRAGDGGPRRHRPARRLGPWGIPRLPVGLGRRRAAFSGCGRAGRCGRTHLPHRPGGHRPGCGRGAMVNDKSPSRLDFSRSEWSAIHASLTGGGVNPGLVAGMRQTG